MHVILVEIEFLSNLVALQVEPQEIQAQYLYPKRLMMTGKDGAG